MAANDKYSHVIPVLVIFTAVTYMILILVGVILRGKFAIANQVCSQKFYIISERYLLPTKCF